MFGCFLAHASLFYLLTSVSTRKFGVYATWEAVPCSRQTTVRFPPRVGPHVTTGLSSLSVWFTWGPVRVLWKGPVCPVVLLINQQLSKGAFIIYEIGEGGENLNISIFFRIPPPQISKFFFGFSHPPPPPPQVNWDYKLNLF